MNKLNTYMDKGKQQTSVGGREAIDMRMPIKGPFHDQFWRSLIAVIPSPYY